MWSTHEGVLREVWVCPDYRYPYVPSLDVCLEVGVDIFWEKSQAEKELGIDAAS
jgi:hypothetical protein